MSATKDEPTQPTLHDLVACVAAPSSAMSSLDGQIVRGGAAGVYYGDVRALALVHLDIRGAQAVPIGHTTVGSTQARFHSVLKKLGDPVPDPTVWLERVRDVTGNTYQETLTLRSTAGTPVRCEVEVTLATDLAPMTEVKHGDVPKLVAPQRSQSGELSWPGPDLTVTVTDWDTEPTTIDIIDNAVVAVWSVTLNPGQGLSFGWSISMIQAERFIIPARDQQWWMSPVVHCDDRRLVATLEQSLADSRGLLATTADCPDDAFLAAGAPWYLTLFGRDSLWSARMLLLLGTDVAYGTLRVLAARQGKISHAASQEQPGKILHEARAITSSYHGGLTLPPVYYGTIDATALWIQLLHDAWRWGLAPERVQELIPALEAATGWLLDHSDADGDGFLEYIDRSGHGLNNQGWKDSGDSVRFTDGSLADAPIALCEVQGYAYAAANAGADLLDAFNRDGSACRDFATSMKTRFRDAFWVGGPDGYPALALDANKRPVDSRTSNMGHLLGTGLLSEADTASVVQHITDPAMDSGFGLRTMADTDGGYAPLSYHCGSVWPHDTMIVLHGMAQAGHLGAGASLVDGLLAAASAFNGRLPELYSGERRVGSGGPLAYPAACHPQAWAAAWPVMLVESVLGIKPDVPGGTLTVTPVTPNPVGRLRVEGVRVGAERLTIEVDAAGQLVECAGSSLEVVH
ncbi:MAG: glycogen debranching N-terminal domain-containing protein [Actinomycetota bacterium]